MRPEQAQEVKAWMHKATNDLRGAQVDLAAAPPLIEDALFHCQQAVEKALKAFLTAHEQVFRKTHDLDELGRACETLDPSLGAFLTPARALTVFAWEFRYPGDTSAPPVEEAHEALALAERVVAAIHDRLPQNARA